MIEQDLRTELVGEASISAIIGDRMFLRDPIRKQTENYIIYNRVSRKRDMVSDQNRFRLYLFSQRTSGLITLVDAVISFLEGKEILNGNHYYSLSFVNQVDGDEKLADGFFWSFLEYEFKQST